MRDYSMDLAKIAANIVTDVMGSGLTAETRYSSDGNNIIMEFDGYPIRGSRRKGKVFVQFPRSTFYVRKGTVHFTPIQQAQCRYYQEEIGRQFAHPHVYNDGHPCWDNSKRERAYRLYCKHCRDVVFAECDQGFCNNRSLCIWHYGCQNGSIEECTAAAESCERSTEAQSYHQ